MNSVSKTILGLAVSAIALSTAAGLASAASKAHAHMGHVSKGWKDTPGKMGLLPTAIAEAKIAAFHAGAAAKKPGNLKWMQTHAHHVLHAVDASLEMKGPGKGYGVLKAAKGAAFHINVAAKQKDASKHVKVHALHVKTSAENTVARAKQIVDLANGILKAKSATAAGPMAKKMATLSAQLETGVDANGDGKITWEKGEGGLNAATKHMGVMYKLEGMM